MFFFGLFPQLYSNYCCLQPWAHPLRPVQSVKIICIIGAKNMLRNIFSENDLRENIKTMKLQGEYYENFSTTIYTIEYR